MDLKTIIVISLCSILGVASENDEAEIHPKTLEVEHGQGFLVSYPAFEDKTWNGCSVKVNNEPEIKFKPGSIKFYGLWGEMTPFSDNTNCGIRVHNVTGIANGAWIFTGHTGDKDFRKRQLKVNVIPKPSDNDCPRTSTKLPCTVSTIDRNVISDCNDPIPPWDRYSTCEYNRDGRMKPVIVQIGTGRKEQSIPTSGFRDVSYENGKRILKCPLPDSTKEDIKTCIVSNKTTSFNVQPGLLDERYSAYLTDFRKGKGVCMFEIPDENSLEEEGIWDVNISTEKTKFGCKFSLGWSSYMKALKTRSETPIVVDTLEEKVTVKCIENAPYPIDQCYLMNEQTKKLLFNTETDDLKTGNCKFPVSVYSSRGKSVSDYTCGFSGPTKRDEPFVQSVKIRYFENEVIDSKIVDRTIECHHISRGPIQACIFVSPKNVIYAVPSEAFESLVLKYSGPDDGFQRGICKATFASELESGHWKCVIRVDNNNVTPLLTEEELEVY